MTNLLLFLHYSGNSWQTRRLRDLPESHRKYSVKKSRRCILTRKIAVGKIFFTHNLMKCKQNMVARKIAFQMVSSGRVLPFWCCLRCCSGTHKDVAGGQKLETQFSRASALLCSLMYYYGAAARLFSFPFYVYPLVNPFGDYISCLNKKVFSNWGNRDQRTLKRRRTESSRDPIPTDLYSIRAEEKWVENNDPNSFEFLAYLDHIVEQGKFPQRSMQIAEEWRREWILNREECFC